MDEPDHAKSLIGALDAVERQHAPLRGIDAVCAHSRMSARLYALRQDALRYQFVMLARMYAHASGRIARETTAAMKELTERRLGNCS